MNDLIKKLKQLNTLIELSSLINSTLETSEIRLLKEARLDPEELEKMNRHTEYGAEILGHIKHLKDIIPEVISHHERIDGNGYHDHLKDMDIPIITRIIAVADTFDTMTTDRPYRKALSFEVAFAELRKNSGTQIDKDVVDTFMRI